MLYKKKNVMKNNCYDPCTSKHRITGTGNCKEVKAPTLADKARTDGTANFITTLVFATLFT